MGDDVSEVINHVAPVLCIQVPMFEATEAIQSARKSGWRSGLHAEVIAGRSGDVIPRLSHACACERLKTSAVHIAEEA
jgi:hypothetical protein